MAIYQRDPISEAEIRGLERALGESEQKRYELERKVRELNDQIEKLTGYGPEYVQHVIAQYRTSLADTRKAVITAENEHKQRLEKLEAQIRIELDRYLTAKKTAELASGKARALEAARASLTNDVVAIVRKASEDNNPFILQPNVQGIGIDIRKLFNWLSKLRRKR